MKYSYTGLYTCIVLTILGILFWFYIELIFMAVIFDIIALVAWGAFINDIEQRKENA